jgi:hypothetical protein
MAKHVSLEAVIGLEMLEAVHTLVEAEIVVATLYMQL